MNINQCSLVFLLASATRSTACRTSVDNKEFQAREHRPTTRSEYVSSTHNSQPCLTHSHGVNRPIDMIGQITFPATPIPGTAGTLRPSCLRISFINPLSF